ncbi:MAG: Rrf2 family transcriptional regulator [Abditibacteriales bacterium]|nr:Rrf2 family transcriptional regulator [Abditibacteriales bacterium]MDW8366431.1 Rrf2 family transcriptional regulator [Abditibacteriales bacterium]
MKLSSRTRYAVQALTYLVRHYGQQEWVQIAEMAEAEKIPKKFLEHVLLDLRKADIVESKKGQRGGYRLARPPQDITLGEALRAVEGRLTPLPSWIYADAGQAESGGLARVLLRVRDAVREILDNTSLEVLIEAPPDQRTVGNLTYFI